jgi:PilZ domain
MMTRHQTTYQERMLAIGGDLIDLIEPFLAESPLAVERVADGRTAILLAHKMRYEHLVVGFPLPDIGLAVFVDSLRHPESASPTARLLLVTDDEHLATAAAYRDEGFIADAISVEMGAERLAQQLTAFMKTSPRVAARVEIEVQELGVPDDQVIRGTTANISESGLLMRATRSLPRGTKVRFVLEPEGRRMPISGRAVVVRAARLDIEGVSGMGLRFVGFEADSFTRLAVRLRGMLAEFVG